MALPIRTTLNDIDAICGYLVTKPTGATLAEAKAVVDSKRIDGRKLSALRFWGLIEDDGNRMKITDRGRQFVKDNGAFRSEALREVVRYVPPYVAMIERAVHRSEDTVTATEVAAHWHEHFKDEVSESEKILNDQAVCFFHIAQGADFGQLIRGRKTMPTRFDFDSDATRAFVNGTTADSQPYGEPTEALAGSDDMESDEDDIVEENGAKEETISLERTESVNREAGGNRVFITHGKNHKILDQVKVVLTMGKFEPVIAIEHETSAMPVAQKFLDDMRKCNAAVIHVCGERVMTDEEGEEVWQINENVLIEIGVAMALYGDKFVLLVKEGIKLPSNLQGLYECRYEGDELNLQTAMKLLGALNGI